MPADIYYHPLEHTEPQELNAEFINSGKIYWTKDVGDRLGNPIFIRSEGDKVQYCTGHFEEQTPDGISFRSMGNIQTVVPGKEHTVVVYSHESGDEYLLHIRNLGSSAVRPALN